MLDRKKLALIHIVKKEIGLSEEEYRKILWETCQVKTAKDLDPEKFRRLLKFLVQSKFYQVNPYGLTLKQKLYIKHLVKELNWTEEHFKNFLNKYYHKTEIQELTRKEAIALIESLKNVKAHKK